MSQVLHKGLLRCQVGLKSLNFDVPVVMDEMSTPLTPDPSPRRALTGLFDGTKRPDSETVQGVGTHRVE